MPLQVTSRGRYALRVMLDLAQHPDEGYISLKTIADRQDISMKYLEAIVGALAVVKQREQPHYGDVGARLCGE